MVEAKLIRASLTHRYRLRLRSDPEIDLAVSITTMPIDPIEMQVQPRNGNKPEQ